jgi:predicted DNA-binding ribbon-helix-helix protein
MWTILFHGRRPPEPHQGFAVSRDGGDGGVQGELGARAIMIEQTEHAVPTVASPKPKHSVVVSGHKTSVSLEEPFWQALREIATTRGLTVRELISLVDEKREQGNLSSALRVFVLEHFLAAGQKETKA